MLGKGADRPPDLQSSEVWSARLFPVVLVLSMRDRPRLLPASLPSRPRHRAFSCSVQSVSRKELSAILSHFILV